MGGSKGRWGAGESSGGRWEGSKEAVRMQSQCRLGPPHYAGSLSLSMLPPVGGF